MTTSAKRVGSRFETDVLDYLRGRGLNAERLAKAGSLDEGDIVTTDAAGQQFIFELKARRDAKTPLSLGAWLLEAKTEADHFQTARNLRSRPIPALLVKRPGKSISDAFVIMTLEDFIDG